MNVESTTSLSRRFRIVQADRARLAALAHLHYHAGPPATCVHVLAAVDIVTDETVGVLAVSMPVLNARWRDQAFPAHPGVPGSRPRYRSGDRRRDARRLNVEVRTISRVIVDPRYRGLGIAARLVRRYLAAPLTPVTEAVAAMGTVSGFFSRAGMTPFPLAPSARDRRLAAALAPLGIDAWMLADASLIPSRVRRSPHLRRELRRWAAGSRGTRPLAHGRLAPLLRRAASIWAPPIAYVGVAPGAAVEWIHRHHQGDES